MTFNFQEPLIQFSGSFVVIPRFSSVKMSSLSTTPSKFASASFTASTSLFIPPATHAASTASIPSSLPSRLTSPLAIILNLSTQLPLNIRRQFSFSLSIEKPSITETLFLSEVIRYFENLSSPFANGFISLNSARL